MVVQQKPGHVLDHGLPARDGDHDDGAVDRNLLPASPLALTAGTLMDSHEIVAVPHRALEVEYDREDQPESHHEIVELCDRGGFDVAVVGISMSSRRRVDGADVRCRPDLRWHA
ncbi:hypothetical protein [Nocardia noduli]|uniref:hypothetical protein n=1 Tax=Nocardia noduli TaxID=2815722 RepID=UPI001C21020F|nr:hypothetical protein [Nocardia noduli]